MNLEQVKQFLRQTLEDHRLSRSEKRALKEVLAEAILNDQDVALMRSAVFDVAREELNDVPSLEVVKWLEEVVKLLQSREVNKPTRAECHFGPGHNCPTRIGGLFATARHSADVCVFTITDDRISDAMIEAHRRGIRVRVVTDHEKAFDLGSDIAQLEKAGVQVRVDKSDYHMHHKFAIFDDNLLLTGSYNWTRSAAEYNQENFVITDDPRMLEPYSEVFEQLWEQFKV